MASIYLPVFRAKNANGVIASGAGLWVYETGTTTAADIFTDSDLTIPASNPLESDSAGYFPQFFIASATRVDLQCRADADDVSSTLLWQALKIDSLGVDDGSVFLRDFGDDGRLQARGSAGVVNLEFGDPVGDNIGGVGRIGGWAGTQGVSLTIDFASVNLAHTAFAALSAFQTLTDGASIDWDTSVGFNAKVTLAGNRAMNNPTNLQDGLTYTLKITQDATGSRTLTWGSVFDWGNVGTPTLSTGAGKVDFAFGIYSSDTEKLHMSFRKAAA
jgi:hypothetical protein